MTAGAFAPQRLGRGIALMLATVTLFSFMDATAKALTRDLPILQIVWARYVLFFFIALAPALRGGLPNLVRTRRHGLQLFRSAFLVASTLCALTAYSHMPLADANAIGSTAPLLVTMLSALVLAEPVGVRRWSAVAAGFVGALIIVRPGLSVFHWYAVLPLGAAVLYASYQIATRVLSTVDPPATTLFWSGTVGAIVLSGAVPFVWVPPSAPQWGLLLLVGLLGSAAHLCIINALAAAPASLLQPFAYVQLPIMVALGFVVFGDFPDTWTFVGAGIIVGGGLYAWHRTRVRAAQA
ncbi:MAG: DMT family transporter [Alphaproteobacteria bacterium]